MKQLRKLLVSGLTDLTPTGMPSGKKLSAAIESSGARKISLMRLISEDDEEDPFVPDWEILPAFLCLGTPAMHARKTIQQTMA
jgi:hypothetical protein